MANEDKRVKLHHVLEDLISSRHVYFQPPESVKLEYPCIVYNLAKVPVTHADDKVYLMNPKYVIRYISKGADDVTKLRLVQGLGTPIIQTYAQNGLYHYIYELYY